MSRQRLAVSAVRELARRCWAPCPSRRHMRRIMRVPVGVGSDRTGSSRQSRELIKVAYPLLLQVNAGSHVWYARDEWLDRMSVPSVASICIKEGGGNSKIWSESLQIRAHSLFEYVCATDFERGSLAVGVSFQAKLRSVRRVSK